MTLTLFLAVILAQATPFCAVFPRCCYSDGSPTGCHAPKTGPFMISAAWTSPSRTPALESSYQTPAPKRYRDVVTIRSDTPATSYILARVPVIEVTWEASIDVYRNGQLLTPREDYAFIGPRTIVFLPVQKLERGDILQFIYRAE